ncbi:unnamed protein product [Effrenium voratum]|nr:unnamed protein product [Effrenium voratum]
MESPGLSPAPETVAETGAARHAQAPGSAGHQEEEEAAQRPKPGQKVHIVDIEGTEEEIGFTDWETFSQHLLRQGIKLKVPKPWRPGSESGRFAGKARDGARLDPAGRGHEAGFGLESRPVHASTNAMLQRAWRSQVATDLEQVYQQRASRFQDLPDSPRYVPSLSLMPLLGKRHMRGWARNRQAYDEEMSRFKVPKIKLRDSKQPIMAFRSTCFCSSNRILPEIETWPVISEDFQDSVYSLSLEHSRSSWSDTSTLLESPKKSPSKRPRGSKGLQNFHRQFRAVLP